jgi:uncharacterized membrane protein YcaP (DUF421 family)
MDKALVCKEDIMLNIRKMKLPENLDDIDIIYIERNGDVTAIRKKRQPENRIYLQVEYKTANEV